MTTQLTATYSRAKAQIFCYKPTVGVAEYHAMIHVDDTAGTLSLSEQLDAVCGACERVREDYAGSAPVVMRRFFVSDAANQEAAVLRRAAESGDCATSVVQQPPLDGSKVALWAYMVEGMQVSPLGGGMYAAAHGAFRHLWLAAAHAGGSDSHAQAATIFADYASRLEGEHCTLADNCVRTWLYVNDIDNNYAGMVRARNEAFELRGLTRATHYIASTGIGGRQASHSVLTQMDAYAVAGLKEGQMGYLYASSHLNRTSDYGVAFERGAYVDYADRRQAFISGTASIDARGKILHEGDVVAQTRRMWENVEALLAEAGMNIRENAAMIVVYLRDMADYRVVSRMFAERFPGKPVVITRAAVCRPGWLIEMECMAVSEKGNASFPSL